MPGMLKADAMGSEVAGRSFQRDSGATFTDVFDKMQAADVTDADFAAEVRSVTTRVLMRRSNRALFLGGGQADGGNLSAWNPQPPAGRQQQLREAAAAMLQQALLGLQAGMQPAQPVVEILPRRKPATLSGLTGQVRDVMGRCPALADASEAVASGAATRGRASGEAEPDTKKPRGKVMQVYKRKYVDSLDTGHLV